MNPPPSGSGLPLRGDLVPLLARARTGCVRSRDELLVLLHFAILRYLTRRLENRCDGADVAEDIAQEALIRLASRLGECRGESDAQVVAWALTVARSRLIDHIRKPDNARVLRLDDAPMPLSHGQDSLPSRPEDLLRRVLCRVLGNLPDETVALLRMRANDSPSWEAVGCALNTTPAGAKRRFQRAQERLRQALRSAVAALPERDRSEMHRRFRVFAENATPPEAP